MDELPLPLKIQQIRADISKLADTINMLRHDGLDTASTQLMLSRKRFELENLMHWIGPERGPHHVAIKAKTYETRKQEVDTFLNRPIWKDTHTFGFEGEAYEVFSFKTEDEAHGFAKAFDGEPFDCRDAGSAPHWNRWYKGRAAKRERNRSPYDFRK